MPNPTPQQGHVDQLLTNISVAYMQEATDFIAGQVFPTVPVANASDKYITFPKGTFFRDEVEVRGLGATPRRVGYTMSTDSYFCQEEALEYVLDDRQRKNATPPHDPERVGVKMLMSQHLIHRERRFVTDYFGTGIWGTNVTGVAAAPGATEEIYWSAATGTPQADVRARKRAVKVATGREPNVLVLGSDVELSLAQNPDLIDRVKYTGDGALYLDRAELSDYFGVPKVVVSTASRNTADEGLTATMALIAGAKDALLVYAADDPAMEEPSGGYIFAWTGLLGGNAFEPAGVWRGRDDRATSDWFQTKVSYDMKVVAADMGVFFSGIVT